MFEGRMCKDAFLLLPLR